MLASHKMQKIFQPVGYLGGYKGNRTKQGTDVFILGFEVTQKWDDDLTVSVVENFWPAIEWQGLTVTVGKQEITKATLPKLMQSLSSKDRFTAHYYYRAFTHPTQKFEKSLPKLRQVKLFLRTGEEDSLKRIAMVRGTGMVITPKLFRSVVPFS